MKPLLGITMGDAAGIGPELILKAFSTQRMHEVCRPLVIGSLAVLARYRDLYRLDLELAPVDAPDRALFQPQRLDVLDLGLVDAENLRIGEVAAEPGRAAVVYTQEAGRMALAGSIDAIVSAPLNKEAMRLAGYAYEGQTEILGELTGAKRYGMILLLGTIRVLMLTTHMALRKACDAVTREKVLTMIELAHETLCTFGMKEPRIAVAGLNPHAGEGGLFGTEELTGSRPAVEEAQRRGIRAIGPVPADVVFVKAREGEYDLVLAMYHDQANMAAKLLGFGEVTTVLAGLPIIRTSVGHGTAFDIAGRNLARVENFQLRHRGRGRIRPDEEGGHSMGLIGEHEDLAEELIRYSRLCYDRGLVGGSGGNLSARRARDARLPGHRQRSRPARRRPRKSHGCRSGREGVGGSCRVQALQGDRVPPGGVPPPARGERGRPRAPRPRDRLCFTP